jgi:hypothetical protein
MLSLLRQSIGCVAPDVLSKGLGAILPTGDSLSANSAGAVDCSSWSGAEQLPSMLRPQWPPPKTCPVWCQSVARKVASARWDDGNCLQPHCLAGWYGFSGRSRAVVARLRIVSSRIVVARRTPCPRPHCCETRLTADHAGYQKAPFGGHRPTSPTVDHGQAASRSPDSPQ